MTTVLLSSYADTFAVGEELKLNMHVFGPEMHVSGIVPLALVPGRKTDVKEFGA